MHDSNGGHRPPDDKTDEPAKIVVSELARCRLYLIMTPRECALATGFGIVVIIFVLSNSLSSRPRLRECSILLKGSQMNAPIGRGVTDGGVLSVIGSTLLAQDE